ncbi:MAG: shikimate kinase [Candidatus Syntrophopropionicum ammoniitolerans]
MKNIVLIGFMATGKSTVGRRLAQCLRRTFVDTDKEIEAVTGKTIAQIFAKDGEKRFRSEENLLVKKLVSRKGLVIATGGGLVLNPDNFRLPGGKRYNYRPDGLPRCYFPAGQRQKAAPPAGQR